jgi:hypothetical protein
MIKNKREKGEVKKPQKKSTLMSTLLVLLGLILGGNLLTAKVVIAGDNNTAAGAGAAAWMKLPVGARAVGLSGAYTAIANEATALYWNPAGLALVDKSEIVVNHANLNYDRKHNFFAIALPLTKLGVAGEKGVCGISLISTGIEDYELYSAADVYKGKGNYSSNLITLAYARALRN